MWLTDQYQGRKAEMLYSMLPLGLMCASRPWDSSKAKHTNVQLKTSKSLLLIIAWKIERGESPDQYEVQWGRMFDSRSEGSDVAWHTNDLLINIKVTFF